MNVLKRYRIENKTVGYIKMNDNKFAVCTGKPSDNQCLCWQFDTFEEADRIGNKMLYSLNQIGVELCQV